MARGKKAEKMLTLEEKLERALVPAEEQPYTIPGNWCWVFLQNLCLIPITDGTHKTPTYCDKENGVPFISAKNVTSQFINWENVKYITKELHEELYHRIAPQPNDILLAKNGTTGVAALVENEKVFDIYVTLAVLRVNCALVTPQYLFRLVNSPVCQNQFDEHLTGIGVPNLHLRDIKVTKIPLAPLLEQQRIVDCIESLFAKLDEAKEKAQAVVDSFELRKSAILHKAFTGKLTEQWRKEHSVGMDSWKQVKFGDLGVLERGRSKHRPRNDPKLFGGKYPFIQTGDVARSGMYIVTHSQTLNEIGMEQSRMFPKGTLCITIAANIGDVSILTYDCCFPDSVVGFTPNDLTSSKFIYYMISTIQRELEADAPATAQKNINLKILNDLIIDLPSRDEQNEIICVLEELFEKEQQAKAAAESVLDQIDIMKKAILARAFRGELGTNDPTEESAVELLKTVL